MLSISKTPTGESLAASSRFEDRHRITGKESQVPFETDERPKVASSEDLKVLEALKNSIQKTLIDRAESPRKLVNKLWEIEGVYKGFKTGRVTQAVMKDAMANCVADWMERHPQTMLGSLKEMAGLSADKIPASKTLKLGDRYPTRGKWMSEALKENAPFRQAVYDFLEDAIKSLTPKNDVNLGGLYKELPDEAFKISEEFESPTPKPFRFRPTPSISSRSGVFALVFLLMAKVTGATPVRHNENSGELESELKESLGEAKQGQSMYPVRKSIEGDKVFRRNDICSDEIGDVRDSDEYAELDIRVRNAVDDKLTEVSRGFLTPKSYNSIIQNALESEVPSASKPALLLPVTCNGDTSSTVSATSQTTTISSVTDTSATTSSSTKSTTTKSTISVTDTSKTVSTVTTITSTTTKTTNSETGTDTTETSFTNPSTGSTISVTINGPTPNATNTTATVSDEPSSSVRPATTITTSTTSSAGTITTETVTIDSNTGAVILGEPNTTDSSENSKESSAGLSDAAVILLAIIPVGVIAGVIYYFKRRNDKKGVPEASKLIINTNLGGGKSLYQGALNSEPSSQFYDDGPLSQFYDDDTELEPRYLKPVPVTGETIYTSEDHASKEKKPTPKPNPGDLYSVPKKAPKKPGGTSQPDPNPDEEQFLGFGDKNPILYDNVDQNGQVQGSAGEAFGGVSSEEVANSMAELIETLKEEEDALISNLDKEDQDELKKESGQSKKIGQSESIYGNVGIVNQVKAARILREANTEEKPTSISMSWQALANQPGTATYNPEDVLTGDRYPKKNNPTNAKQGIAFMSLKEFTNTSNGAHSSYQDLGHYNIEPKGIASHENSKGHFIGNTTVYQNIIGYKGRPVFHAECPIKRGEKSTIESFYRTLEHAATELASPTHVVDLVSALKFNEMTPGKKRPKGTVFYPEAKGDTKTCGIYEITCTEIEDKTVVSGAGFYGKFLEYKIRNFNVKRSDGSGAPFTVRQFHTPEWLDNTAPPSALIREINSNLGDNAIVSHCSAGVGRSGVQLVDYLLFENKRTSPSIVASWKKQCEKQCKKQGVEDVLQFYMNKLNPFIDHLRQQRSKLVIQSLPQYISLLKIIINNHYSDGEGISTS